MANKESNSYIFMYSTILVVVAAAVLAVAAVGLKPFQKKNYLNKLKKIILMLFLKDGI